jgi:hypothetical protein
MSKKSDSVHEAMKSLFEYTCKLAEGESHDSAAAAVLIHAAAALAAQIISYELSTGERARQAAAAI